MGRGLYCCVRHCQSASWRRADEELRNKFFRVPRDKDRCRVWLELMNCSSIVKSLNQLRVCGIHFTDDQFTNILKTRLIHSAVPSLHLPPSTGCKMEGHSVDSVMEIKIEPWWTENPSTEVKRECEDTAVSLQKHPKIEIKEEPVWTTDAVSYSGGSEPTSQNDIKEGASCITGIDEDFPTAGADENLPAAHSRLNTEGVCNDSSVTSESLVHLDRHKTSTEQEVHGSDIMEGTHKEQLASYRNLSVDKTTLEEEVDNIQAPQMEKPPCSLNSMLQYKCCGQTFISASQFEHHNMTHEDAESYICGVCQLSFTRLGNLRRHCLIHEGKRPYKCEVCQKSFTRRSHLQDHSLVHGADGPHTCEVCKKTFKLISHLRKHSLIHGGKGLHQCNICDKVFTRMSNLKEHFSVHESKRPHKCAVCKKSFKLFSHLKKHGLIHENKRPHKCEICQKSFKLLSALKRHCLLHEDKRLYKCEICEKGFNRVTYLKQHILIHEGARPHTCEVCQKNFKLHSHLKTHGLTHVDNRPHKCKICQKSFKMLSGLKRHSLIHEGKKATVS